MPQKFRVQRLDHVEVFVPNRYEAADWYSRVLGLEILPQFEHWAKSADGPLMIACADGTGKMALFDGEPRGTHPDSGHRRVAFAVSAADFVDFLNRTEPTSIHHEDGKPIQQPKPVDHGQSWSTYFCDPWGNRYEITSYDYEEVATRLT